MILKQYPFINQLESTDCGPACVAMLIKKFTGILIPLGEIRHIIFSNEHGSNFLGIKKGLETLGIIGEVSECERDKNEFFEMSFPIITQINSGEDFHFIVIYKVYHDRLLIADPLAKQKQWVRIKVFLKEWVPYVYEIKSNRETERLRYYTDKKYHSNFLVELWKYRWLIIVSWLILLTIYALGILFVGMYSTFYDIIIPNKVVTLIMSVSIFYTILLIIQIVLALINVKVLMKINNGIDQALTEKLLNSFFSKNYEVIGSYKGGELITRFRNISQIRGRIVYIVQSLPMDIIIIILTAIFLIRQSFPLAILTLIPILIFLLIMYLSHETMQKNSINLFEKDEDFNTTLIQSIKNIETIKNFNVIEKFEKINNKKLNNLLNMSEKFVTFDSFQSNIKNLIISLFTLYIFALGAYLVINDNMANGMLLVFNSLSIKIFSPFQKIASLQSLFEQGKIAEKKYEDIINTVIPRKEGNIIVPLIEKISLHNVSFIYNVDTLIFDDLELTLLKNSNTAILGKSGSGKTTLAKLLANYFDICSGDIKINEIIYQEYSSKSINDKILYVPQYVEVFNDTILNNITLGRDISLSEIEKRAKSIGFNDIVNHLPDGYLTIIGENGLKLSMGQMQMLNILRATLTEYSLIIFDEVTNGLDLHLKKSVANYLLKYGNIKVFLTHDIEFALLCDNIYIINNHKINKVEKEHNKNLEKILQLL